MNFDNKHFHDKHFHNMNEKDRHDHGMHIHDEHDDGMHDLLTMTGMTDMTCITLTGMTSMMMPCLTSDHDRHDDDTPDQWMMMTCISNCP